MKLKDIIAQYESYCPQELSLKGDTCGLQFGSLEKDVETMMISLDIRENTVEEAIQNHVDFILVKHAPVFKPVKNFTSTPQMDIYLKLIKHDIAVYVSHSNIDVVPDGLNDWFCELLKIEDTEFLEETQVGYGIGRIGNINPQPFLTFAETVKQAFGLENIRLIQYQNDNPTISRVAICGGSGDDFYQTALNKKADVFITGDIYYHTAQEMLTHGLLAIDPGHHIEILFAKKLTEKFTKWAEDKQWEITVLESQSNTNPFKTL